MRLRPFLIVATIVAAISSFTAITSYFSAESEPVQEVDKIEIGYAIWVKGSLDWEKERIPVPADYSIELATFDAVQILQTCGVRRSQIDLGQYDERGGFHGPQVFIREAGATTEMLNCLVEASSAPQIEFHFVKHDCSPQPQFIVIPADSPWPPSRFCIRESS